MDWALLDPQTQVTYPSLLLVDASQVLVRLKTCTHSELVRQAVGTSLASTSFSASDTEARAMSERSWSLDCIFVTVLIQYVVVVEKGVVAEFLKLMFRSLNTQRLFFRSPFIVLDGAGSM